MKTNLKDLATALGVSISTVSKAMRDSYELPEATKKRIREMAEKMGYVRSPYAGHLRNHKSKTIAVIVPEINNNFFIQAISGAEEVAQLNGYHVLIYVTNDSFAQEERILKHLQNGRVDGVLMSLSADTVSYDHINDLVQCNVGVVFFDRVCHQVETAKVITDDFVSGFNATEHLVLNGCRNIAYLSISESLSIDNKRKQGYLEALAKYDIEADPSRIIRCNGNEKSNQRKIRQLLSGPERTDGIFASVEKLALDTYTVCKELDLEIPASLKVICFSNLSTAPLLNPSLTTITQPALEIGKQAATILFKHLSKNQIHIPNENIVLKSELVKRDSTKKVNT